MAPRRIEIFRTPYYGYTDYAVGWLYVHLVLLPTAAIVAAEGGVGLVFAALFGGGFVAALVRPRGVVRRCLRHSRFYRFWLATTVAALLAIVAPGVTGNLPPETFNSWLILVLVVAGLVLFAGWFRRIRSRL